MYVAFYSCPLYCKAMVEDTFVSYQLDQLIEASSASILDIITASGLPLPATQEDGLSVAPVEESEVLHPYLAFHPYDLYIYVKVSGRTAANAVLMWLKEEGLPAARMEALALGEEMDMVALRWRALEKFRQMSLEEKRVWRRRAKEEEDGKANTNQK